MFLSVPFGSRTWTAVFCRLISCWRDLEADIGIRNLRDAAEHAARGDHSSPFCSASIMAFVSLARFICGRIMRKYRSTNISTIGSSPMYQSPLGAAWANAGEMTVRTPEGKNGGNYSCFRLRACAAPFRYLFSVLDGVA